MFSMRCYGSHTEPILFGLLLLLAQMDHLDCVESFNVDVRIANFMDHPAMRAGYIMPVAGFGLGKQARFGDGQC